MALLNDEIRGQLTEMLRDLPHPVRLVLFTQPEDCQYCSIIHELVDEVAATSPHVSVEVHDFAADKASVALYKIDKAPAIAIVGARDYGLRFFGIPANYEFSTLLHAIQLAGRGASLELDAATREYLQTLNQPVHYQVFVTPTCPYCPPAAMLAYEMAMESEYVHADIVEASEFQELSARYNVMGVPLNVINDSQRVEGRVPAPTIVNAIKAAVA